MPGEMRKGGLPPGLSGEAGHPGSGVVDSAQAQAPVAPALGEIHHPG